MDLFTGLANRAESLLEKIDGQAARGLDGAGFGHELADDDRYDSSDDTEEERLWRRRAQDMASKLHSATRYVARSVTPTPRHRGSSAEYSGESDQAEEYEEENDDDDERGSNRSDEGSDAGRGDGDTDQESETGDGEEPVDQAGGSGHVIPTEGESFAKRQDGSDAAAAVVDGGIDVAPATVSAEPLPAAPPALPPASVLFASATATRAVGESGAPSLRPTAPARQDNLADDGPADITEAAKDGTECHEATPSTPAVAPAGAPAEGPAATPTNTRPMAHSPVPATAPQPAVAPTPSPMTPPPFSASGATLGHGQGTSSDPPPRPASAGKGKKASPGAKSSRVRRAEALEEELNIMERNRTRMQADLDAKHEALNNAVRREKKLEDKLARAERDSQKQISQLTRQLKDEQKAMKQLEAELKELQAASESFDEDYDALEQENETLQAEVNDLKSKLEAIESTRETGVAELEQELKEAQDKAEESRNEFVSQLSEAEGRVTELERLNAELSNELAAQQRKLEEHEATLHAQELTRAEQESHDEDVYQAREMQRQAEEMLSQERKRAYVIQQDLDATRNELDRANDRYAHLERRSRQDGDDHRSEVARLSGELEHLRRRDDVQGVAALEQRLAALSEHLVAKQKQIELLTSEKGALRQRLKNLDRQYNELKTASQNSNAAGVGSAFADVEAGGRGGVSVRFRRRQEAAARRIARLGPIAQYEGVAQALDAVDQVVLHVGGMLYQQPWARLAFLFYFMVLHVWVVFILAFHTHESGAVADLRPRFPPGMESSGVKLSDMG